MKNGIVKDCGCRIIVSLKTKGDKHSNLGRYTKIFIIFCL